MLGGARFRRSAQTGAADAVEEEGVGDEAGRSTGR